MKKRVISAAVMVAVCLPLLLIGKLPFAIAVGVLSLFAYKEIINLRKEGERQLPIIAVISGLISLLYLVYSNYDGNSLLFGLNYSHLALSLLIVFIPVILISDFKLYSPTKALSMYGMILLVGLGLNMFISIVNYNLWTFIYLLSITICTDSFAYFTGRLIGKHKCSKLISPNKTWEGCIGGTVIGTIIPVILYVCFIKSNINVFNLILITMLLSVIGQFGDLFFSSIKREYGIKDFSNLIPGHGGILDRIDSIIFVVIAYLMFHMYL